MPTPVRVALRPMSVFRRVALAITAAALVLVPLTAAQTEAAGTTRSAISLTAPSSAAKGAQMQLQGVLWRYGTSTKIGGATVVLQRSPRGKNTWSTLTGARTDSTGGYLFTIYQIGSFDYRTVYGGSAVYTTATSPTRSPIFLARGSVRSAVNLTAPASGTYGSTITLTGMVWRYGSTTRIANAPIYLHRMAHGGKPVWTTVRSTRSSATGTFSFTVNQGAPYDYRVYYDGSATYTVAYSGVRYPVVDQKVLFDTVNTTDARTGLLTATSRVFPSPPNGTLVTLQRWDSAQLKWADLATAPTSGGMATITATRPGSVDSYRTVVGTRTPYGAGRSGGKDFAHFVWRGLFARSVTWNGGANPALEVDQTDPKRFTARLRADKGNGYVRVYPTLDGCRQLETTSTNTSTAGDVAVGLINAPGDPQDTLERPNDTTTINADLRNLDWIAYMVWDPTSDSETTFQVTAKISVLCSH